LDDARSFTMFNTYAALIGNRIRGSRPGADRYRQHEYNKHCRELLLFLHFFTSIMIGIQPLPASLP